VSGLNKTSIVVFASGKGTNFRALCEAATSDRLSARIEALVCDVPGAGAVEIAREFKIPAIEVSHRGLSRSEHEAAVIKALSKHRSDWIVLAGYMRLFTPEFVARFQDAKTGVSRMVNIHPSLLPAFAGKDGYGQALRHGVKVTGCTVHLVGAGLDDGPIIAQRAFEIADDDTEERLRERGLKLEHELYVETLQRLMTENWRLVNDATGTGRARVVFDRKGRA
jgi:phosphoribosylglycinamide formyltransferase-1